MNWRLATKRDCKWLAELNHQLIEDECHHNDMTVSELEARMAEWIHSEYEAILFEDGGEVVAYALYRILPAEIYLRHFFVVRHRRRIGLGRRAIEMLRREIWPAGQRMTVSVLLHNEPAVNFWRAMGYRDYSLTMQILPTSPPAKTIKSG